MQCTGKQSTDLRYSQPLSLSTGLSTSMKRRVSQVPHIWHIVSLIYSGTSASAKRILVLTHDQAVTRLFFGSSFLIRRQGTCAVMMWSLTQLTTIHVEYMSQTTYSLAYIDTQYIFGSCRTLQRNGGAECMHKHMQHRGASGACRGGVQWRLLAMTSYLPKRSTSVTYCVDPATAARWVRSESKAST